MRLHVCLFLVPHTGHCLCVYLSREAGMSTWALSFVLALGKGTGKTVTGYLNPSVGPPGLYKLASHVLASQLTNVGREAGPRDSLCPTESYTGHVSRHRVLTVLYLEMSAPGSFLGMKVSGGGAGGARVSG